MKLIHIISSLEQGGAQAVLYDLVTSLQLKACEQTVLYFHGGPYVQRLQEIGITLHQVKGLLFQYDPFFLIRLFLLLRTIKPDCIHTLLWMANTIGSFFAWALRIPCVSVLHNNVDQNGRLRTIIDTCALHFATELVAVSQQVACSVYEQHTTLARTITIIPNGIDVQHVQNSAGTLVNRSQFGLLEHHFIIGSVGRLHAVKHYDFLIASFAQLYHTHNTMRLLLVGYGQQEQQLRMQARSLNIEQAVFFVIGQLAYSYYRLFDCFVQTSFKEGISIALLEAMSNALPCIVSSTTNSHTVIEHGVNGMVVQAGNSDHLIDTLMQLSGDARLCAMLGNKARDTVEKQYTKAVMAQEYMQLFTQKRRVYDHK